jgi:hypothetical protein
MYGPRASIIKDNRNEQSERESGNNREANAPTPNCKFRCRSNSVKGGSTAHHLCVPRHQRARRYHDQERHDTEPPRARSWQTRRSMPPLPLPAARVVEFDSDAASAGFFVFTACESSPASGLGTGEGSGAGDEGGGRRRGASSDAAVRVRLRWVLPNL